MYKYEREREAEVREGEFLDKSRKGISENEYNVQQHM